MTETLRGIGGAPTRETTLPEDAAARKQHPVASGVLDYFPDAIVALSHVSWRGNEQHNAGQPLHWARGKSSDESDALLRHFLRRGTLDGDGIRHSAKMAWRALALLQKEIEGEPTRAAMEQEAQLLERLSDEVAQQVAIDVARRPLEQEIRRLKQQSTDDDDHTYDDAKWQKLIEEQIERDFADAGDAMLRRILEFKTKQSKNTCGEPGAIVQETRQRREAGQGTLESAMCDANGDYVGFTPSNKMGRGYVPEGD